MQNGVYTADVATLEDPISTKQARQLAADMGVTISIHAVAAAAKRGAIEGAVQLEGQRSSWVIPQQAFIEWVKRRRPRGPGAKRKG